MKSSAAPASSDDSKKSFSNAPERAAEDESTGAPGLPTWKGVYWIVFALMVLWIALLAVLTKAFS